MANQVIEGVIVQILKPESGTSKAGKEWNKQEFVVETQEQFPKKVCFTLFGDKITLLNQFTEGMEVSVSYNLESRDFNNKWFHSVTCWKIENKNIGSQTTGSPNNYQSAVNPSELPASEMAYTNPNNGVEPEDNDLPFS